MVNFEIPRNGAKTAVENTRIKIIGIGDAGGDAVSCLLYDGLNGADFILVSLDARTLPEIAASQQVVTDRTGSCPDVTNDERHAADDVIREKIHEALEGAYFVVIVAGMGEESVVGVAAIAAQVARELGALTVSVAAKPFSFEGAERMKRVEEGIAELAKRVHYVSVVRSDAFYEYLDTKNFTQEECFDVAADVLPRACANVIESIKKTKLFAGFEDSSESAGGRSVIMMGEATASGADRARVAAENAAARARLENVVPRGARDMFVNIVASRSLKLRETREIISIIHDYADEDACVAFETSLDDGMGENLRVTMVASGLVKDDSTACPPAARNDVEGSLDAKGGEGAMDDQMVRGDEIAKGDESDGVEAADSLADLCDDDGIDPLFGQACEVVLKNRRMSISLVQRHLRIGYHRASRLIKLMEVISLVDAMQSNGSHGSVDS